MTRDDRDQDVFSALQVLVESQSLPGGLTAVRAAGGEGRTDRDIVGLRASEPD